MSYAISYPSESSLAVELTTETAKDAVKIAQKLADQGHVPTIETDGQRFTLEEFEIVAADRKSGEIN